MTVVAIPWSCNDFAVPSASSTSKLSRVSPWTPPVALVAASWSATRPAEPARSTQPGRLNSMRGCRPQHLEERLHGRDVVGEPDGTNHDAHAFFSSVLR